MGDPWYWFLQRVGVNRSVTYRESVTAIFAQQHLRLSVTIRTPRSADDDLAYLAAAPHLVPTKQGRPCLACRLGLSACLNENGSVYWRSKWTHATDSPVQARSERRKPVCKSVLSLSKRTSKVCKVVSDNDSTYEERIEKSHAAPTAGTRRAHLKGIHAPARLPAAAAAAAPRKG